MNVEEIKDRYRMRDILDLYGIPVNRAGFCRCPFHTGDREPSMKIYARDFHCYACGANGDIFDFVERMDGVGFKEAFQSLGGTYEKPTFSSRLAIYRSQKRQAMRKKEKQKAAGERKRISLLIGAYRWGVEHNRPLSDAWCENYNKLQYQLYLLEEQQGMR